jgi:hypothetical protein
VQRGIELASRLSPVCHYVNGLLGILLKGVGCAVLWPSLAWLLGLGVAPCEISLRLMRHPR